jgi:hypothetical protein
VIHERIGRRVERHPCDQAGDLVSHQLGAPPRHAQFLHPALHREVDIAARTEEAHTGIVRGNCLDIAKMIERNISEQPEPRHLAELVVSLRHQRAREINGDVRRISAVEDGLEFIERIEDRTRRALEPNASRVHLVEAERIPLRGQKLRHRRGAGAPRPKSYYDQAYYSLTH